MPAPVRIEYRAKPSVLGFMANVWRPSRGFSGDGLLPDIQARWTGQRASRRGHAEFLGLCGLPDEDRMSILHPHSISFPMLMAVLSHPHFPLPIWTVLQVRNRMVQHESIAADAVLDFTVHTGARRLLEKGAEVDLHVSAESEGRQVWECVNTFYARGRFGAAEAAAPASPVVAGEAKADWQMPGHGRWRYGRLSGDLNPLHMNDWYARRFGYPRAFAHPQRVIGQCLARLGMAHHAPLQLETWIKGPVFYDARLSLRTEVKAAHRLFALHVDGDARPAIVGRCLSPKPAKPEPDREGFDEGSCRLAGKAN